MVCKMILTIEVQILTAYNYLCFEVHKVCGSAHLFSLALHCTILASTCKKVTCFQPAAYRHYGFLIARRLFSGI